MSAKVKRPIINAISKVSPPAHLPTYRKVPKKNKIVAMTLGISLCIRSWLSRFIYCLYERFSVIIVGSHLVELSVGLFQIFKDSLSQGFCCLLYTSDAADE